MTERMEIGLLHPGAMGHVVAEQALKAGNRVSWVSEGRSADSRARAAKAGLHDAGSLGALAREAEMVLSICPPHAAVDVARAVAAEGFSGIYLDANAVAPATARQVASIIEDAGGHAIDGGIVGPPPKRAGTTRLYLSGTQTDRVAALFAGSNLGTVEIGPEIGAASALKMCYAAYSKGTIALLIAIRALASAEGVEEALVAEWAISQPGLADRSLDAVARSAGKAWRYVGEMREIASSFEARGLPGGFHRGAAELYEALAPFKNAESTPDLADVVRELLGPRQT